MFETLKSFWQNRELTALLLSIFVALLLFAASGFDQGIDFDLAGRYIGGDYYIKIVQNKSDPSVMKNCTWIGRSITKKSGESMKISCNPDCSLIGQDFDTTKLISIEHGKSITVSCKPDCSWLNQGFDIQSGNQTSENFEYSCWEQHPWWGRFTLFFTFLPGLVLLIRLLQSKEVRKRVWRILFAILASLIFPLTLFMVKIISFFQFGEEWKRVTTLVTLCESSVESFLQGGLQLYIIMARPDRNPTFIQWMAVLGSFIMIGFGQARAVFANRTPGASFLEDTKKMVFFTLGSTFMIFFVIATATYIAIIDKILFFVSYGVIASLSVVYLCLTRFNTSCQPQDGISKRKWKLIMLSIGFLIETVDCIIGAVLFNMDPYGYKKLSYFKSHLEGNILLVVYSTGNFVLFILCLIKAFRK